MKKRWGCAFLASTMLFAVLLAGCSKTTGETLKTSNTANTRTVTITAITDETTTEEGIARVQDAMNVISKSQYKTQVVLVLKTADEYEDYVNAAYEYQVAKEEEAESLSKVAREEAKKKKEEAAAEAAKSKIRTKWTTTAETIAEETVEQVETQLDEYGRQVLKYPDAKENQLDVVFMTGVGMYQRFVNKEYLVEISTDLRDACAAKKDLTKYIYPTFIKAGLMYGELQYAYTNNHMLDTYTYLLVDKNLADQYDFSAGSVTTLSDCEAFLDTVKENETGYTPINTVPEMPYLDYYGEEPALLGAITNAAYSAGTQLTLQNLFLDQNFINYTVLKDKLEKGGYTATGAADEKFAIQAVEGYYNSVETKKWEDDYYVITYKIPKANNNDLYAGAFGISKYSANPERALEIISLLNTNSAFVNAYAYGVEGIDYTLNEDGTAHRLDSGYSMKLEQCGNNYMAYVPEGSPADLWEISKVQNQETYTKNYSPFTYLSLEYTESAFAATIPSYVEYSNRYIEGLNKATDKAAYFESVQRELEISALLRDMLNGGNAASVAALYSGQHADKY